MASVTHQELRSLIAFHRRDGFTVERLELAVAQLTSVQINKAKGKSAKKITPSDLMPYKRVWRELRNEIDPEFHQQQMRELLSSTGVRVVKGERKKKK